MSVKRVQAEISSSEFTDWMAFYAVERELASGETTEEAPPSADRLGEKIRAVFTGLNRKPGV